MKVRLFPPYGVKPRPAPRSSTARARSLERGLLSLSGGKIRAFMTCILLACCAAPAPISVHAAERIPRAAYQHRDTLIRAVHAVWGLDAPVAVLAAQVHTESLWKADAVSPAGAMGIAQIMPSTARWLPDIAPALRGQSPAPYNPGWALRAMCEYDLWLHDRQSAMSAGATLAPCDCVHALGQRQFVVGGHAGLPGKIKGDILPPQVNRHAAHPHVLWGTGYRVRLARQSLRSRCAAGHLPWRPVPQCSSCS